MSGRSGPKGLARHRVGEEWTPVELADEEAADACELEDGFLLKGARQR